MKRLIPILLLLLSAPVMGERVIQLGDDALVTLYMCCLEDGKDQNSKVHIQLGENGISSPTAAASGEIYIVLDPFEPLGIPCGVDGSLKSSLFKRISSENSLALSVSDFQTFSFFTPEKSTVGFIKTSTGSAGTFPVYYFYDLKTQEALSFRPSCEGETHWIDTVSRPPVVGVIMEKYWSFRTSHADTYAMRSSLIDKVWAGGDVLPDDHSLTLQILEEYFQDALSDWNESVIQELGTLISGSNQSAVTNDPWEYEVPLKKLMKYLYFRKHHIYHIF